MEYAVSIDATGSPLTEDQLVQLLDDGQVFAGDIDYTRIEATMTVQAPGPLEAGAVAIVRTENVRGPVTVDALEILTTDEQDRRLAIPPPGIC